MTLLIRLLFASTPLLPVLTITVKRLGRVGSGMGASVVSVTDAVADAFADAQFKRQTRDNAAM
jgi:hypothetical protein